MTEPLFKRGFVYPSDSVGPYAETEGQVVHVKDPLFEDDEVAVQVLTPHGLFTGFTARPPKVGYKATVRVYDCGGGWYPDNRIVRWSVLDGDDEA